MPLTRRPLVRWLQAVEECRLTRGSGFRHRVRCRIHQLHPLARARWGLGIIRCVQLDVIRECEQRLEERLHDRLLQHEAFVEAMRRDARKLSGRLGRQTGLQKPGGHRPLLRRCKGLERDSESLSERHVEMGTCVVEHVRVARNDDRVGELGVNAVESEHHVIAEICILAVHRN
eukprot:Amastigsp_a508856_265.p2 type:complete len:174 gc:universal Amastigsp_a508856_265:1925-1404(-)